MSTQDSNIFLNWVDLDNDKIKEFFREELGKKSNFNIKTRFEAIADSELSKDVDLDKFMLSSLNFILDQKNEKYNEPEIYLANFNYDKVDQENQSIYRSFKNLIHKKISNSEIREVSLSGTGTPILISEFIREICKLSGLESTMVSLIVYLVFVYASSNGRSFKDIFDK